MISDRRLSMWTVYERPLDFPSQFVVRRWLVGSTVDSTADVLLADDLATIREKLPQGLFRIPAHPGDDPAIVETWP